MKVTAIFKSLRVFLVLLFLAFAPAALADAEISEAEADAAAVAVAQPAAQSPALYYAIAASIAFGCMSAGYAVGKIGAAVMGAAAEKPEIIGKAIPIVGLGEGIALFGFLVALFMYTKI